MRKYNRKYTTSQDYYNKVLELMEKKALYTANGTTFEVSWYIYSKPKKIEIKRVNGKFILKQKKRVIKKKTLR